MLQRWRSTKRALLFPLALLGSLLVAQAQTVAKASDAPASAPDGIDPTRLAAARIVVDHIFPAGVYVQLMGAPMTKLMDAIIGGSDQIPFRELAAISGANSVDLVKADKTTLNDIMTIYDPAYHERKTAWMHVMMSEMRGLMNQVEPDIRDGLAQAYATKFTTDQLADMNRFFDTPSGQAYASNALMLEMDPAVATKMQSFVPLMAKQLSDLAKKAEEFTADLPKPRTWEELTPVQRSRLAQLLGLPEAQVEANMKAQRAGEIAPQQ